MSNSEHDKKKKYSQRGLVIALGTSNQRARVALSYLGLTKPLLPRARHVGGPCATQVTTQYCTTITDDTDERMQLVDNDTVRAFVTPVYALMENPVLILDIISSS